ncbi:MAG: hypothetical protein WBP93_02090 [Pyrinomonadaceae bacterium]
MKLQVKIIGMAFIVFAAFLGLFVLLLWILSTLEVSGLMQADKSRPGFFALLGVSVLLLTVASWFFQIGTGLLSFKSGSRLVAIIFASILLIGLNIILMLLKDQPHAVGAGRTVFHLTCICFGVYTVLILLPGWSRQLFQ